MDRNLDALEACFRAFRRDGWSHLSRGHHPRRGARAEHQDRRRPWRRLRAARPRELRSFRRAQLDARKSFAGASRLVRLARRGHPYPTPTAPIRQGGRALTDRSSGPWRPEVVHVARSTKPPGDAVQELYRGELVPQLVSDGGLAERQSRPCSPVEGDRGFDHYFRFPSRSESSGSGSRIRLRPSSPSITSGRGGSARGFPPGGRDGSPSAGGKRIVGFSSFVYGSRW